MKKRLVVGISGASGIIYAVNLLKKLQEYPEIEVHGVVSSWALENLELETELSPQDLTDLLDIQYDIRDLGASIASGSFLTEGMIILPASMKTVAGIACGFSENLIGRAADVVLKERRSLIIVPRETPLSVIHLENLTKLATLGAQIIPPIPAFYYQPQTIQDLLDHHTMRLLDALGIPAENRGRWEV